MKNYDINVFNPYMNQKYPGFEGIEKKCNEYDKIDYSKAYNYLNQLKNIINLHKK